MMYSIDKYIYIYTYIFIYIYTSIHHTTAVKSPRPRNHIDFVIRNLLPLFHRGKTKRRCAAAATPA